MIYKILHIYKTVIWPSCWMGVCLPIHTQLHPLTYTIQADPSSQLTPRHMFQSLAEHGWGQQIAYADPSDWSAGDYHKQFKCYWFNLSHAVIEHRGQAPNFTRPALPPPDSLFHSRFFLLFPSIFHLLL